MIDRTLEWLYQEQERVYNTTDDFTPLRPLTYVRLQNTRYQFIRQCLEEGAPYVKWELIVDPQYNEMDSALLTGKVEAREQTFACSQQITVNRVFKYADSWEGACNNVLFTADFIAKELGCAIYGPIRDGNDE